MIIANETEYKMKTVIGFVSMTINQIRRNGNIHVSKLPS